MVLDYILLTTTDALPQDSTLTNIMENTLKTALNTQFGTIALLSFIAALVSAFFAVGSLLLDGERCGLKYLRIIAQRAGKMSPQLKT